MLTAAGNINQDYSVIGITTISVVKSQKTGCSGGGLPVDAAYSEAVEKLKTAAREAGGDGVIHINFDHRVSSSGVANFELYAWGTVIKLG